MFTKASIPTTKEEIREIQSFSMPKQEGNLEEYVCVVKENSPFEYINYGNVDFAKYFLPTEASLLNSQKKHFPVYPTKLLSENQAKAIMDFAKSHHRTIPQRFNYSYDPKTSGSQEFFPEMEIVVGDYLILKKKNEFNPVNLDPVEPIKQEAESLSESIYKAQKRK